jgi:hypothetical protein
MAGAEAAEGLLTCIVNSDDGLEVASSGDWMSCPDPMPIVELTN